MYKISFIEFYKSKIDEMVKEANSDECSEERRQYLSNEISNYSKEIYRIEKDMD